MEIILQLIFSQIIVGSLQHTDIYAKKNHLSLWYTAQVTQIWKMSNPWSQKRREGFFLKNTKSYDDLKPALPQEHL